MEGSLEQSAKGSSSHRAALMIAATSASLKWSSLTSAHVFERFQPTPCGVRRDAVALFLESLVERGFERCQHAIGRVFRSALYLGVVIVADEPFLPCLEILQGERRDADGAKGGGYVLLNLERASEAARSDLWLFRWSMHWSIACPTGSRPLADINQRTRPRQVHGLVEAQDVLAIRVAVVVRGPDCAGFVFGSALVSANLLPGYPRAVAAVSPDVSEGEARTD